MKLTKASRHAGSALAVSALVTLASVPAAHAKSTGWTPTATHALALDGAARGSRLDDAQAMRITVALGMRDAAGLREFIGRQHTVGDREYGRTLTGPAFTDRFAPSAKQAQAVADYLVTKGFRNVEVSPNRLFVSADGSAKSVRSAFNTDLATFSHEGRRVYGNTRDAQVPSEFRGTVAAVLGLQNAHRMQPMNVRTDAATTTGHNPLDFQAAYHVGNVPRPTAQTVGIITAGDMSQTLTDLAAYVAENDLATPNVSVVHAGPAGTDTGGTIEWDLDSQSVLGMSGGSIQGIVFYAGTSLLLTDITLAMNRAVVDNVAKSINVSLGTCEKNFQTSGELVAEDNILQQGIAQGQTFFVSSGDAGAKQGCSSVSRYGFTKQVSYPASSRYAVAVGGTTLSTDSVTGAYASEKAWGKSGGGKSVLESSQPWQVPYSGSVRGVPDIALTGDPNSGAVIVNGGSHTQVGGTSLSSPLMAAVWARVLQTHPGAGFAAPHIYATYLTTPSAFHDVTKGSNALFGGYTAVAGYDYVTGLGSLDVQKFNDNLQ